MCRRGFAADLTTVRTPGFRGQASFASMLKSRRDEVTRTVEKPTEASILRVIAAWGGRLDASREHQHQDDDEQQSEAAAAVVASAIERAAAPAAESPNSAMTKMMRRSVPIDMGASFQQSLKGNACA